MMSFPWLDIVQEAIRRWSTPFYLAAWDPVRAAYEELSPLDGLGIPVRHWFSVKTQPMKPLLAAWRERLGLGAEVVSLVELLAARDTGFAPHEVIVNGLAKHAWLPTGMPGLRVHLDSSREAEALGLDRLRSYRLGVRVSVPTQHDPEDETIGGQFGIDRAELPALADQLRRHDVAIEGVHFHLRSNIRDPRTYARAAESALAMSDEAGLAPIYLDCGGGFPVPGETTLDHGGPNDTALPLTEVVALLGPVLRAHPSIAEVWFENGRFLTSRCAVLVLRILDVKERAGCRFLLCDGGRTNNAMPADWQPNPIRTIPPRTAPGVMTVICGPTCTAYDRLARRPLPGDLTAGDYLVWFNAGAYHLSWETRFSQGLAKVIWCDDRSTLSLVRAGEDFRSWWGTWA
jgi:diaminopimelate decarboxylase